MPTLSVGSHFVNHTALIASATDQVHSFGVMVVIILVILIIAGIAILKRMVDAVIGIAKIVGEISRALTGTFVIIIFSTVLIIGTAATIH